MWTHSGCKDTHSVLLVNVGIFTSCHNSWRQYHQESHHLRQCHQESHPLRQCHQESHHRHQFSWKWMKIGLNQQVQFLVRFIFFLHFTWYWCHLKILNKIHCIIWWITRLTYTWQISSSPVWVLTPKLSATDWRPPPPPALTVTLIGSPPMQLQAEILTQAAARFQIRFWKK